MVNINFYFILMINLGMFRFLQNIEYITKDYLVLMNILVLIFKFLEERYFFHAFGYFRLYIIYIMSHLISLY